jgi:1-aminocyclopropane-1-carboxylate synthase 1/2/6
MVSKQASRLSAAAPAIAVAHFRAEADPYHPTGNPGGYINLGTAENRLVWDLLAPKLTGARPLTARDTRYAPLYGSARLRGELASFLGRTMGVPIDSENIVVVAGATAALDIIATTLCDPGEAIVVPAPYYGAFDVDLAGRSECRLIPAPLSASDSFWLTGTALDRTLDQARNDGVVVRAVALTSPSNPVGQVFPEQSLREVLQVAAAHDVDVISDEIYANSVFGPQRFTSMATLAQSALPAERVHLIWGFAKDFGLPGFKAGLLHTTNPDVRGAARELAYFAPLSTDTQAVLADLLADPDWVDAFLAESRRRLGASYAAATAVLDSFSITYAPAQAGFSIWVDLSPWLAESTFDAEWRLWRRMYDSIRVSILPGAAFSCPEPGWFRLCHTTDAGLVQEALTRVGRLLTHPAVGARP